MNLDKPSSSPPEPTESVKKSLASSGVSKLASKPIILSLIAGLIVAVLASTYFMSRPPVDLPLAQAEPDPLAHERPLAPDNIEIPVLGANADAFKLKQHRGDVVLMWFWTADCDACWTEIKELLVVAKKYQSSGLQVRLINMDIDAEAIRRVIDLTPKMLEGSGFEPKELMLHDPTRKSAFALRVDTSPSTVLIDRSGRVASLGGGSMLWTQEEALRMIEDLLAEPASDDAGN